jgi:hypothetical protein
MQGSYDISVVIVNYKVKEYVLNLLHTLYKGKGEYSLQIIVIDNASGDNALTEISKQYTDITVIQNDENLGFGKANNQGINLAKGKYTLLINPDTLISEDTLEKMYAFMEANPKCGVSSCKILNADGSFAKECKRSIPDLVSAVNKVTGLDTLFPKSRLFGKRYLSWIDENETSEVPVVSGSFMFWNTDVLKSLGGFDEAFFMYAEDDDICLRAKEAGYKVVYAPITKIIHYKGESTKKRDYKYAKIFNQSLYQFFIKHYGKVYGRLVSTIVLCITYLKTIVDVSLSTLLNNYQLIIDLVAINLALIVAFLSRFDFDIAAIIDPNRNDFFIVNAIISVLYFLLHKFRNQEKRSFDFITKDLINLSLAFLIVAGISFLIKELAYSRLILVVAYILSLFLAVILKPMFMRIREGGYQIKKLKVLLIGELPNHDFWKQKIEGHPSGKYLVHESTTISAVNRKMINSVDEIFFVVDEVQYDTLLEVLTSKNEQRKPAKICSQVTDTIIGKSSIEYFDPPSQIEMLLYERTQNKVFKRVFDVLIAIPCWGITFIPRLLGGIFKNKASKQVTTNTNNVFYTGRPIRNLNLLCGYILLGEMSWVGAPMFGPKKPFKAGLFGIAQYQSIQNKENLTKEEFSHYYLKHHSLSLDIDLFLKGITYGPSLSEQIEQEATKV